MYPWSGGGGEFNRQKIKGIDAGIIYEEKAFLRGTASMRSNAFTLAEVLIALAIIGVVAAMTIPTFMANTAGAQFRTGFKKGITVLTQAASANYATEGYDFSGTNGAYGVTSMTGSPTPLYSATTGPMTIGFNTGAKENATTTEDRHPDTPSLFHLFQNNLNMKNSNEITNYAVMPADVALNCLEGASGTVTIPGMTNTPTLTQSDKNPFSGAFTRATVSGEANGGIQTGGGLADLCDGRPLGTNGSGGINQGYMFQLEDGMVFTYDPAQAYCSESNPCFGYIDVNGPTGPNRVIACSEDGGGDAWITTYGRDANSAVLLADCTVESKDITDIYPVVFYGSTVKPASIAAKSVLYSKKSNQTAGGTTDDSDDTGS